MGEYSHGMKKKLALGCALIHGPRLLFLDEPFEGIDAVAVSGIRRLLVDLVGRGAVTIFLTSHVLEVVERLVTHVGIIRAGTAGRRRGRWRRSAAPARWRRSSSGPSGRSGPRRSGSPGSAREPPA